MKIKNLLKNIYDKLFIDSKAKENLDSDKDTIKEPIKKPDKCFACTKSFDCDCYRYGCICRPNRSISYYELVEERKKSFYDECGCDIYIKDELDDRKTFF